MPPSTYIVYYQPLSCIVVVTHLAAIYWSALIRDDKLNSCPGWKIAELHGEGRAKPEALDPIACPERVDGIFTAEDKGYLRREAATRWDWSIADLPVMSERPPRLQREVAENYVSPAIKVGRHPCTNAGLRVETKHAVGCDSKLDAEDIFGEEEESISKPAILMPPEIV
jgi:hypothetical protein